MTANSITVYWRPGCGFCASLLLGLERSGLAFDRVDIWQDEAAARFVRSVAGGNETVPTVRIGAVALVNPSIPDVLRTVAAELPERLPEGYEPPRPGLLARAVTRVLGG
ncbi:MAG: NrdH-redoxin [Actinobacteria bacterium]|nr:NrdH-redoxin [Actinomycetota bacterium]